MQSRPDCVFSTWTWLTFACQNVIARSKIISDRTCAPVTDPRSLHSKVRLASQPIGIRHGRSLAFYCLCITLVRGGGGEDVVLFQRSPIDHQLRSAVSLSPPELPSILAQWVNSAFEHDPQKTTHKTIRFKRLRCSTQRLIFSPRKKSKRGTLDTMLESTLSLRVVHLIRMVRTASIGGLAVCSGKVIASLIAAQKVFMTLYTIGQDWYTGNYIRKTLEKVEQQYKRRYQIPAILRSIGRLGTHLTILFLIGILMEWMVGLSCLPCSLGENLGCHWWCGLLWLVAVSGPGHAAGVAIAIWGRGLRIQVADYHSRPRISLRRTIKRPWTLLRWVVDPDKWFREIIRADRRIPGRSLKPFVPHGLMFPATWSLLRLFLLIAVAKEMYGSDAIMHSYMKKVLVQQAFSDEWYRVLMCEKRVALGIAVMIGFFLSTLELLLKVLQRPAHQVSSLSILLTVPSLVAVVFSGWMNILIFFERDVQIKKRNIQGLESAQKALAQYKTL